MEEARPGKELKDPRWRVKVVDCRECRRLCFGPSALPPGTPRDGLAEFVANVCNRQAPKIDSRNAVRRWVGPAPSDVAYLCPACDAKWTKRLPVEDAA